MSTRLRSEVRAGVAALALLALAAHAETMLPSAHDLRASSERAAARGEPLVLLFSLPDCPYCETVRASTYRWLLRDGHAVEQVEMRDDAVLRDFAGAPTRGAELARRLHVKLAPTVLFVGPGGRELAPRLVGAGVPDYYSGEVDDALRQAQRVLRGGG
jgi:thioredoxin-related protein